MIPGASSTTSIVDYAAARTSAATSHAPSHASPRPIEAHGIVGEQGTVALVADDGTVERGYAETGNAAPIAVTG